MPKLSKLSKTPPQIETMELWAWVGEDDHPDRDQRSGEWGIKQGVCPAGYIPIVAVRRDKVEHFSEAFEKQARAMGKKIRLVKFVFAEVIRETTAGN